MTRARPFKIPVGLAEYRVTFKRGLKDPDDPKEELNGLTTFSPDATIELNSDQSAQGIFLTFWHEWLHAALHELGYDHLNENEAFIEGMSQALARAVQAAPGRFKDPD